MVTAPLGPIRVGVDAEVGGNVMRLDYRTQLRPGASFSLLALWGF